MNSTLLIRSLILATAAWILSVTICSAAPADDRVYAARWKKADSLEKAGLPKSALEEVNAISDLARTQKNEPQQARAMMWKLKLESQFREDYFTFAVSMLKSEITVAGEPLAALYHSLLAEVYDQYLQQNAYRISDRSRLGTKPDDSLQTWDRTRLSEETAAEYLASLLPAATLQAIPVSKFSIIMESKSEEADKALDPTLRPTLYDFLLQRALDYFTASGGTKSGTGELPSNRETALRLFREAAAFHAEDPNPRVFISYELARMAWLHETGGLSLNDSVYSASLEQLEKKYLGFMASASVSFARAGYLVQQGNGYDPLGPATHKWDLKKALEVCENAIRRYPESEGGKNCAELAADIRKPLLEVTTAAAVYPGKKSLALLEFKNITTIYFRLVSADPEEFRKVTSDKNQEEILEYLFGQYFVKLWSQELPSDGDYQTHRVEITVPETPSGYYMLLASADKNFSDVKKAASFHGYWSTQLSYISNRNGRGGFDLYVLDRETGKPLREVTAEAWTRNYNYRSREWNLTKTGVYTTDENGFFSLPEPDAKGSNRSLFLKLRYRNDLFTTSDLYLYPVSETPLKTLVQTNFYTDRAIYRPGQTIWFKGIVLEKTGDIYALKTGYSTTVTFRDANYQEIAKSTFTSGEFGSFSGSFIAPTGVLAGNMTISNETGSVSFSVEEYRRPTFEVTWEPVKGNYRLSETVTIKGKAAAYAGQNVDGAAVAYRVVRSARFPWYDWFWFRPYPVSEEKEIAHGTARTAPDGTFTISFTAEPDASVAVSDQPVFDFMVYADVTDLNGEMQSGSESVSVGTSSLLLSTTLPDKVNLDLDTAFRVIATNLGGQSTSCEVKVVMERLKQPDRAYISRLWQRPDLNLTTRDEFHTDFPYDIYGDENNPMKWPVEKTVFSKTLHTGIDTMVSLNSNSGFRNPDSGILSPGTYKLTLAATDPFGQRVEKIICFTAFDPDEKEMPVRTMEWFVPLKTSGEPGEKASFLIGSTEDDINLIYEIRVHDSLYSRSRLKLSDRQQLVEVPILEGFRGNFAVNFVFIKHNRIFQYSQTVVVPWSNRKLDIAFETFRDRITPGAKEEWRIRISGPDKKAAGAEFMATLYDASLDQFRTNQWYFNVLRWYGSVNPWEGSDNFTIRSGGWSPLHWSGPNYKFRETDRLNWFGNPYSGGGYFRKGRYALDDLARPMMGLTAEKSMDREEALPPPVPSGVQETANLNAVTSIKPAPEPAVLQVRRDFRETAFFYPSLRTDSAGALILTFTAPESLTRWRFMGLAYSKDLKSGSIEKTTVTRKDLMVMPNPPRFLRQGDTLVFSAKVVNLSDADQTVRVTLDLTDPLNQKSLNHYLIDPSAHQLINSSVAVSKGSSAMVSWTLAIPSDTPASLLQYRITAAAGNFSDGEEKIIPVLPNRTMVTETLPLPVKGSGTFKFRFEKLAQSEKPGTTLKNYRLTLEFAGNPAWYAIQALPSLNEITYTSADNVFAAYYSNALASFIAASDPKIRSVFESWKQLTPDALLSNLEKNLELKTALLQETPWVLEARDETANKQKLGLYFDRNNLEQNLQNNLSKLQKMQLPGGAWSWFEGMPESRWVTLEIVTGLGRLHHLGVKHVSSEEKTLNMIRNAIIFLDEEMTRDYEFIKKHYPDKMDENHLSSTQIQYLYAISLFRIPESGIRNPASGIRHQAALDYFTSQARKYWLSQDLVLQGMIALALHRTGDQKTPQAILKSLGEKALHSAETGMYWAIQPGFSWSEAPVETQAMLIEAFDEILNDRVSVDEMNVWLLKQKQTQLWNTRRATVDACYALLLRGTGRLAEDPGIRIRVGDHEIDPAQFRDTRAEAGSGYFKLSWKGEEITPGMSEVTVSKSSEGVAWGGLYWQYFENLDRITQHQTPLKVSREIYAERMADNGPVLEKISDSTHLEPGEKVKVRIVLTVDRDLEFVHMKDLRAGGLEPRFDGSEGLSGYRYQDGLGYYQSVGDVGAGFFFDRLPKGTWVFEYPLKTNNAGDFSNGITTVQCLYAPEFAAHSEGIRVNIK